MTMKPEDKSYRDSFAQAASGESERGAECKFTRGTLFCLEVSYRINTYYEVTLAYDFLNRVLLTRHMQSQGIAVNTTPFAQLDAEVLDSMYEKLVELGGKPPRLGAPATSLALKKGPQA